MKYSIWLAIIVGVLGLSACEKTTVQPVPVPQTSPPPAVVPVPGPPGPQGAPGPEGAPGKGGNTTVIIPPAPDSDKK